MAAGQEATPGDVAASERLRRYWTVGAGGAKIGWNTPKDWTRCVNLLSEHMSPENAKGYCNLRHKEMTGRYPNQDGPGNDNH